MITVASNEQGQSVLEFLFCVPVIIGLAILLIRVNTAIQISIVNQQYSRAQALYLAFNSPYYPEVKFRGDLIAQAQNQLVLGVAKEAIPEGSKVNPSAPSVSIVRSPAKALGASDAPQTEARLRAIVRIRNTVTLCTNSWFLTVKGAPVAVLPLDPRESRGFEPTGENLLLTGITNLGSFCGNPLGYITTEVTQ